MARATIRHGSGFPLAPVEVSRERHDDDCRSAWPVGADGLPGEDEPESAGAGGGWSVARDPGRGPDVLRALRSSSFAPALDRRAAQARDAVHAPGADAGPAGGA